MKFLLVLLFLGVSHMQDEVLFKVITYSDGVTIDGVPVSVGMNVTGSGKKVVIPQGGYMGVILKSGDLIEVTDSRTVARVGQTHKITATGAVHADPPEVQILGVDIYEQRLLLGDSIFLAWRTYRSMLNDTATIRFANVFDEDVGSRRVVGNSVVLNVKGLFDKENVLLIAVEYKLKSNNRIHSDQIVLRKDQPGRLEKINLDLSRLPASEDRLFLESAVYLLDNAAYDSGWSLYKIFKSKKTTTDPILAAYYKLMYDRYQLANVKLD